MAAAPRRHRSSQELKATAHEMLSSGITVPSLARHLDRGVGNAFVLYANYKHYHRQTLGPHFRDLHILFAEFALEALDSVDELAKRIHMISDDPPTHLLQAVERSALAVAAAHSTIRDMVEEADRNVLVVLNELREAARIAEARHDRGTLDLASRLVQIFERHEWWFRDILSKREGPQLV